MNKNIINIFQYFFAVGIFCLVLSSCNGSSFEGKIIVTRVAGELQTPDYASGNQWRYIPKAQIAVLDPENGEIREVLTEAFYSAQSPAISYDGKKMLFAGQKTENDTWQIWEMELTNQETRQLTSSKENCTDPDYLPKGYFIYSSLATKDSLKAEHSLFTCKLDGTENTRITFNPSNYFASKVLMDGKVVTIASQIYPKRKKAMFFSMLTDGTKAEVFYKGDSASNLITKIREGKNRKLLFIEATKGKADGGKLVSINYNRPLHSRTDLAPEIKEGFLSVCQDTSGALLVAYRKSTSDKFALYNFDTDSKKMGKTIYSSNEFNVIDAVVCRERIRPKKLPSAVKEEATTGQLLCQDINMIDKNFKDTTTTSKIEVLGLDSSLGVIPVEKDGSFYLKVKANMPFKIRTIDKEGNIVHGPSDWIWLRPNERRGCVGCHADPELVPENALPVAVKKSPVAIPSLVGEVIEK